MSKQTLVLIFILVLITSVLLAVALSPKQEQKERQSVSESLQPTPLPTGNTVLSLTPSPLVMGTSASPSALSVAIDTGKDRVTAVQLELSYNPQAVDVVDIAPLPANGFFSNPVILLKNIDKTQGRISFAIGISPTDTARVGQGTVAQITFLKKPTTIRQTLVTFLPKTLVTAEGVTTSVLREGREASIILSQ